MTHAELTDAVRASELLAASRTERHACYRNRVVPGLNAEPAPGVGVESESRVHARRPEETGSDGWGAAPSAPADALTAECGHCLLLPDTDPMTGQYDLVESASCPEHGWENHPVIRQIPGAPRAA